MKKSEQHKINQNLDSYLGSKKAYKKYVSTESSSLLKRFAAESHRERVREIKREYKKITKQN
jgi:hypothetical protein